MTAAVNQVLRRVPAGLLYLLAPLPAGWWLYLGLTGGLGVEPIQALEHRLGEFALQLLIASLCISPLRDYAGINLVKFRRAIALIAVLYVSLHLAVWLFLDVQVWSRIWADILKRPYTTVGMISFVILVPLAATSNDLSIRRMGPQRWRRLHRLFYPAILLAGLHFVMLAKTWQLEPLIYLAVIAGLLALRMIPPRRRAPA